ncbi:MAG: arylsulfatase [Bacteroidales bacterium]|jgi:arylsulfatase A-like enzyme|nr:arylsulfatase [Bacteroidales bacterium]
MTINILHGKTGLYLTASVALAGVASCGQAKSAGSPPNIILIVADDLGYGDLGCYGQQYIKTPHIDRLAKEGMLFTQYYAGCTVSAPSRSSLVTGLHTGHSPIRGNREMKPEGQYPQPAGTYTIAKMLKENGYATGCFGKWGLGAPHSEGAPENQGFDEFFGYNCQRLAHNYYPYRLWHNRDTVWLPGNAGHKTEQYAQDLIQQQALRFIENSRSKPFFAFLTCILPHAELVNPDDSIIAGYRNRFPEKPFKGVDGGAAYKDGGYGSTPHPKADFAAMITRFDAYVGEITELLERLGLDKNTVVMITSDNGPHREGGADPDFFKSYGPLRGIKRDLYEGGIRVPLIVRYPEKIKAGAVCSHISAFWDVMPTLAELAGAKAKHTDGISFLPTLLGKTKQRQHDYLYWEFHEQGGKMAVRKADWKAVRLNVNHPGKPSVELYNLSEDIHEDHNVAEQHPEIVAEMLKIMQQAHQYSALFPFNFEKQQ